MLASPSINPRVDVSIVAASAVMVVVPITVLIFATNKDLNELQVHQNLDLLLKPLAYH